MKQFLDKFEGVNLTLHGVILPTIQITPEQRAEYGAEPKCTNAEFLRKLVQVGYKARLKAKQIDGVLKKEYSDRCKQELETFEQLGFVDYVLMVWDVNYFAVKNDIPTSWGRGSVCGSLVLYLIGVHQVDPMTNNLYFERFISKARAKAKVVDGVTYVDGSLMPDIDSDFCYHGREKILAYLDAKYPGRTCKLLNLSTFTGKILMKDCYKVVEDASESDAQKIADMLTKKHGNVEEIGAALEKNEEFQVWAKEHERTVRIALKLQNLIRGKGQHASAILVCHKPITEMMPLELSSSKEIVNGYDMYTSQNLLVKLDILGLKTLTTLYDCCKQVGIHPFDIDLNDKSIYNYFQKSDNYYGIFQLESEAQGRFALKIRPKNFFELTCLLAISRPGAMAHLDQFCAYIHDGEYTPINKIIDPILKRTGGVCLFQEQLMQMVQALGFTKEESELLRRAVGKKKPEEVAKWEKMIYEMCAKNKIPKEVADITWKIANDSAGYQFNLSHAAAYACVSAATTYMKANHPKEFFLANLRMSRHEVNPQECIASITRELPYFGIQLLPPDLMKSDIDFKIDENSIRFGLSSIKTVSDKTIEKLSQFRKKHANKFEAFIAAKQAGLNIGVLSSIIQSGCLDFGQNRSRTVLEAQIWNLLTKNEKQAVLAIAKENDFKLIHILKKLAEEMKDEKGKPIIAASRFDTLKRKAKAYQDIFKLNNNNEQFACYWYERHLLGFNYSSTLKEIFGVAKKNLSNIREVLAMDVNEPVAFMGEVTMSYAAKAKKKDTRYLKVNVRDETAEVTVLLFNEAIQAHIEANGNKKAREGDIVFVRGKKKDDAVFADGIIVQNNKIYMKLSEVTAARDEKEEGEGEAPKTFKEFTKEKEPATA